MRKFTKILCVILAIALLAGLLWLENEPTTEETAAMQPQAPTIVKAEKTALSDIHLRDNQALYAQDDDTGVVTMYLTVSRGNAAENTNHTWEEINTYSAYDYDRMGGERYQMAALLQVGDDSGPLPGELGYGEIVPNATVQIRGQTSTKYAQKNYKIEIKNGKGLWHDQRTIALNKHMAEASRFRNKLVYDLLEEIPQLMALRTQFVHLYVKDTTGENPDEFVDYGLYTQVEQLNSRAMRSHGLDEYGHLYKINMFEFYRYEDEVRLIGDPLFNQKAFDARLETKGSTDHQKLIRMLEAVNNLFVTPEKLLETYFDQENLSYWMAFQILIGNADTQSRNFYLYSPLNSERWYIIPWDHDGSFKKFEYSLHGRSEQKSWDTGVSNYWGNILFQRLLKSESFRQSLDAAIVELRSFLTEEKLRAMIADYAETVRPYAFSYPDNKYIGVTPEQYDAILVNMAKEVEVNYQLYLESWKKPMPFYIGRPVAEGNGKVSFVWDASYDFDAEDITYSFEIARDYSFENILYSQDGIIVPQAEAILTEPGQYFVRIRATNASGYTQDAFDYYVMDSGKAYGMLCFYVMEDGSIEVDVYEEG